MRTYTLEKSTYRFVLPFKLKHPVVAARSPANLWRTTNVTTGTRYTIYLNFLAFPLLTSPAVAIYNPLSLRLPIHSHHIQPSLKTHTADAITWHPPSRLRNSNFFIPSSFSSLSLTPCPFASIRLFRSKLRWLQQLEGAPIRLITASPSIIRLEHVALIAPTAR